MKYFYDKFNVWYYDLSILKKLYYMNVVVIIIPILLLSLFANKVSSQIIVNKTIDAFSQDLKLIIQSLNIQLENAERTANIIIVDGNVQHVISQVKYMGAEERLITEQIVGTFIDSVIEPNNQISSVVISGNNNLIIGSRTIDTTKVQNGFNFLVLNKEENLFKNSKEKLEDLHVIDYEKFKTNVPGISLSKNIFEPLTGRVIGEITLNINEDILSKCYSQLQYENTGRFCIINKSGVIVSSKNKEELFKNISKENYVDLVKKNTVTNDIFTIRGIKYLITSSKYESMNWIIVGIVPLHELTADNNKVTTMIYIIGSICMFIAMIISMFISKSITKPIIKLSKSMEQVGHGDFDIILKTIGNDEVGMLLKGFNKMTEQISNLINQVFIENKKKNNLNY